MTVNSCNNFCFEYFDSVMFLSASLCVLCVRGKIVLGYTEAELRVRGSGYQFIHAADMLYCAENHVRSKYRPNNTIETGAVSRTVFSTSEMG